MSKSTNYTWNVPGPFPAPIVDCPINIAQELFCDSSAELHSFAFLDIAIIAEGEGFYRTESDSYPVSQGDVFLLPKYHVHGFSSRTQMRVDNILLQSNVVFQSYPEILTEPALCCFRDLEPHFRSHDRFQNHLRLSQEELQTLLTFCSFSLAAPPARGPWPA